MLDIPYIGAYRIRVVVSPTDTTLTYAANFFLEMNSLPMDCSFAIVNDGSTPYQSIGRFVPTSANSAYVTALQPGGIAPAGVAFPLPDYYSWTKNIFNYLTVQSSTDTYLPNFDPNLTASNYTGTQSFAYPPQNTATPIPPTPTLTANPTATDQTAQDNVGVEGLININTASWKVLSMLPLTPSPGNTQALAQAIALYRDGDGTAAHPTHGPFTSIFDLNLVPGFQTAENAFTPVTPSSFFGLLSPADSGFGTASANHGSPLGSEEDYQGDCLELTRISNLITTRSDTFTIYVVLQGWQNVGTATAQPTVTRRFAYIVDRSAINADPNSRFLKTLIVPND